MGETHHEFLTRLANEPMLLLDAQGRVVLTGVPESDQQQIQLTIAAAIREAEAAMRERCIKAIESIEDTQDDGHSLRQAIVAIRALE